MSNTAVVASDVVVPCNRTVRAEQRPSGREAGARATVSFSDSRPLAKMREEFRAEANAARASSRTRSSDIEASAEHESDPLRPSWEATVDGRSGQGQASEAEPKDPEAIDASTDTAEETTVASEAVVAEATGQQGEVIPMEVSSEVSEVQADASSMGTQTTIGTMDSVNQAVSSPEDTPVTMSDKDGADEAIPQTSQADNSKGQTGQELSGTADAVESGAKTEVVADGSAVQTDSSAEMISTNTATGATQTTGNKANPGLSHSDQSQQSAETLTGAESQTAVTGSEAGLTGQGRDARAGGAGWSEADVIKEQGQADASTQGGSGTENGSVVRIGQMDQPAESQSKEAQVVANAYRQPSVSEGSGAATATQAVKAEPLSKADGGQGTPERSVDAGEAPASSTGSVLSGTGESPYAVNPQNSGESSSTPVPAAQAFNPSEAESQIGSTEGARTPSETSAEVAEVQSTNSQRPSESLATSSQAEATPFKSSSESISQQISDSVQVSLARGDKELVIRLNPPELGSVSVRLEERGDTIAGILEVGKSETRREIEQALPQVIQSLQEAGVQIRRVDLTVADQPDKEFGREQLQQEASGQEGRGDQGQSGRSGSRPEFAGAGMFQRGTSGSSVAGEPLGDWSQDRIDMLV